jgi:hypothetical protein
LVYFSPFWFVLPRKNLAAVYLDTDLVVPESVELVAICQVNRNTEHQKTSINFASS